VYASQPPSPATTQHSLPSGRYSLLGPDLHRLDRTSLRLAHLFDYLVGAPKQRFRSRPRCIGQLIPAGDALERARSRVAAGLVRGCLLRCMSRVVAQAV
jgi:hypothetical protein